MCINPYAVISVLNIDLLPCRCCFHVLLLQASILKDVDRVVALVITLKTFYPKVRTLATEQACSWQHVPQITHLGVRVHPTKVDTKLS
jgi:hypothetical protein